MRKNSTLKSYMSGNKKARSSKEFRMIDSMQLRAPRLDPFLYRRHDRTMLITYFRANGGYEGWTTVAEIDQDILRQLDSWSDSFKAWFNLSSGRLDQALVHYDDAINARRTRRGCSWTARACMRSRARSRPRSPISRRPSRCSRSATTSRMKR